MFLLGMLFINPCVVLWFESRHNNKQPPLCQVSCSYGFFIVTEELQNEFDKLKVELSPDCSWYRFAHC